MKMKRTVAFLLCAVLALSALAGCGNTAPAATQSQSPSASASGSATPEPAKLEPIEYTMFIENSKVPAEDNKFLKYIKDNYGITFKFDPTATDLKTKVGVMIASNTYPDIIAAGDESPTLLDAGAYMPLETLLEKNAPNLIEGQYQELWKKFHTKDGHVYLIPGDSYHGEYIRNEQNNGAYWIQKAVLKEYNFPTIKTIDEFLDIVGKYAAKYPTIDGAKTVPVAILTDGWRRFCLINGPVNLAGYPNNGDWIVDPKTSDASSYKVDIAQDKDITKRYLQIYNAAFNKGLIDPESFTMTYDQYTAKIASGAVLGFFDHKWEIKPGEKALREAGKLERTYVPLPITFDKDTVDRYTDQPTVMTTRGKGLSKNCKEPERFLKLLNDMATEEFQLLFGWGFEGEDYFVDEKGRFNMTSEQYAKRMAPDAYKWDATAFEFVKWSGTRKDGNSYRYDTQPEIFQDSLTELDLEILKAYNKGNYYEFLTPPPKNPIFYPIWDLELTQEQNNNKTKLQDITFDYMVKAITAKPEAFEGVWNEFQGKLKTIDYQPIVSALQKELERRLVEWK